MIEEALEWGYWNAKLLSNGEMAGCRRMMYTTGLFVGLTAQGYRTRFCFHTEAEAEASLVAWDGTGDPPGNWVKEKGAVERMNPNYKEPDARDEQ